MAFSSNQPQITNQLPFTINLPDIRKTDLFQNQLDILLRTITSAVNQKEAGLYNLVEQSSNQQYFQQGNIQNFRNVYRKVMDFVNLNSGNIAGLATVFFPHGISNITESAGIQANCTDTNGKRFSLVFPNVWVDSINAYFVNPFNVPLTQCDIIINILKET